MNELSAEHWSAEARALIDPFARLGVVSAAELHLARLLCGLGEEDRAEMHLAVALAARAPRLGHTGFVPGEIAATVVAEVPVGTPAALDDLPWPETGAWLDMITSSSLVSVLSGRVGRPDPERPMVLAGEMLSLQRYWAYERLVAENLARRLSGSVEESLRAGHEDAIDDGRPGTDGAVEIARVLLSGPGSGEQIDAVRSALHRAVTVLTGGPGTGKTTTVAALLAALLWQADTIASPDGEPGAQRRLEVALAAPTGKAAARLSEAFRSTAARLPAEIADRLSFSEASTIHRLLGGSRHGFAHHRSRPLPHDVVILDEASMVSLPLIARLLDAIPVRSRLVIVGDPGQLASVEAGTVLADLVAAADSSADGPRTSLAAVLAGGVVRLTTSRRFSSESGIGRLAAAITAGDSAGALEVLGDDDTGAVRWIRYPEERSASDTSFDPVVAAEIRAEVIDAATAAVDAARNGDRVGALASLGEVRLLCAHRRGPFGVGYWNHLIRNWVIDATGASPVGDWLPGEPVLVTANDYRLGLFNGDLGITVSDTEPLDAEMRGSGRRRFSAVFGDPMAPESIAAFDPAQIDSLESAHAMTIHKSQGSEFDHVVVVLPPSRSRLASRELLYTAVTRARQRITVVGSPEMITAAVSRPVKRATGLVEELHATDIAVN
jgi:exodeoxyribonuclease V alpha subunit